MNHMTVDELIARAKDAAKMAPNYREDCMTPADCYAKANHYLLLALIELNRAS